jgi:ribonuclease HI
MPTSYQPVAVYADGGCVSCNPSPYGGSWAWRQVDARGLVPQAMSGLFIACGESSCQQSDHWPMPVVTNNAMEFVAVVLALEYLPPGWHGQVCSDSRITLERFFNGARMAGIPDIWRLRGAEAMRPLDWAHCTPVLVKGHPTRADLATGVHAISGRPVSEHNVRCDAACTRQNVMAGKARGYTHTWGCKPHPI